MPSYMKYLYVAIPHHDKDSCGSHKYPAIRFLLGQLIWHQDNKADQRRNTKDHCHLQVKINF